MIGDIRRPAIGRMFHATLLIGGLSAMLAAPAALADSGGNHQPPALPAQARAQGEALTQEIVDLGQRHGRAGGAERGRLLADLRRSAEERYDLLAGLIETNPGEVLRLALPDRIRAGMPAEVQAWLEQRAEIEGELEVLHIDMPDPALSRFAYFLETDLGERFSLHFAGKAPDWVSGTQVRAGGVLLDGVEAQDAAGADGALAVEAGDEGIEVLAAGGTGGGSTPASGVTNTFGEQQTVVLLVNFQNNPSNQPWTTAQVANVVNGTTNAYFLENSYQQTWLSADVFGWYTMPLISTTCVIADIEREAQAAATAAGVNLSAYSRYVYAFPSTAACAWSGLGTVGGNPSRAWINGTTSWVTYAHELGHNFGLYHSNALECGAAAIGDNCTVLDYGDKADVMGSPTNGHFNAFQKDRLGWLGFGASPPLLTVETSGTYTLNGYAPAGTGPKAVKVLKSTDPATGFRTWYFVEYRQQYGFDSNLAVAMNSNVFDGALVHSGSDSTGNSSHLLDMTPGTTSWFDPALAVGSSHDDPGAGVTITTLSENGTQATIDVDLGTSTCVRANPMVAISPSESPWVPAGAIVAYTVTVTNNDSASCTSSVFNLTSAGPSGWSASYDTSSLTLAHSVSGARTLSVTSAGSAANGFYNVTATATNAGATTYAGSAIATYVVSNAVNQPPTAANDNGTTPANSAVTVAVLSNDSDPDGDALSVTTASQGSNGAVAIQPNNTVIYTPNAGFTGSDGFTYTISDGRGGTAGASVAVSVAAVNQPPVAANDNAKTPANTPVKIAVLSNDYDPNNDPLAIQSVTQGLKGTVTINPDKTVTYAPKTTFKGSDSFTYTINDGHGATATATVTVTKSKR